MSFDKSPGVAALVLLLAAGAATAGPDALSNEFCPVTTDERAEAKYSADYQGRAVYFCCGKCRKQFLEDPAKYAANLPAPRAHAGSHSHETGAPGLAEYAGRFHPVAVHFPIALLAAAAAAELGGLRRRAGAPHPAAVFCTAAAAITAPVAAGLGWLNASTFKADGETAEILFNHRWLGVAAAAVAVLSAIAVRASRRAAYRLLLVAGTVLVVLAGHFGGMLSRGPDYFAWPF